MVSTNVPTHPDLRIFVTGNGSKRIPTPGPTGSPRPPNTPAARQAPPPPPPPIKVPRPPPTPAARQGPHPNPPPTEVSRPPPLKFKC
ncbi:hypothetical protein OUZ56_015450 [Daphnia magna]|uniref:Uncharacterized protein n=1 Tax=Daphnia magna TaxID=35525 RepID=A0ABR0AMW3_9CRUS|nr:hypothetical protein OUZ56_015450 [Daphnia magna]